jgi:hypothetical protein
MFSKQPIPVYFSSRTATAYINSSEVLSLAFLDGSGLCKLPKVQENGHLGTFRLPDAKITSATWPQAGICAWL